MPDILKITMLPAKEGDCLVIACGENPAMKYILIDAGRVWTYENALKQYLTDNGITKIELLIVTHVDRDHIDGMLRLIKDPELNLQVSNVWFNTWDHLRGLEIENPESDDTEEFGARMGEELSSEIIAKGWRWNTQFGGRAIELHDELAGNIIRIGDISLTLLSPNRENSRHYYPIGKMSARRLG